MTANAFEAMHKNHSFWQHKYGDYAPNHPLPAGQYKTEVLVIGAGYTGLTSAREVLRDNPGASVMVLDAHEIGFGASGRNGGFSMTLFGMEPEVTVMRWGEEKARQAQQHMRKAVAYVRELIEREALDCDYEHTGMWRVAYSEAQERRLKKTFALLTRLAGPGNYEFLERSAVQEKLNAPAIRAAIHEPGTGILDPCKHVRALKRLAEQAGADVFENTPVLSIHKTGTGALVKTANAEITTDKLVLATNAWTHTLAGPRKLRNRQRPLWTYQIVSEPLTPQEWEALGWQDRMSIEDNRQLVHYMRVTECGRITMGGGNIALEYGRAMNRWSHTPIWQDLENHFRWLFPTLAHKAIAFRWGGPISANLDMTPEIGFIGDESVIYACGCIGHGVSLTQLNGRVIADLIAGNDTAESRFWIVKRRAIPLPPGNLLAFLGAKTLVGAFKGIDRFEERKL